jgi:hypothetical protein
VPRPRRAAAREHGPGRLVREPQPAGALHHARSPEVTLPGPYNNNLQIVQTPGYVVLFTEMIPRRARRADGRPAAQTGRTCAPWMGDSRGHWEGDTLVVDTTNFTDRTNSAAPARTCTSFERLHARRREHDRLPLHRRGSDDVGRSRGRSPTPIVRPEGPIYEFACHEGNYGLRDISVARAMKSGSPATTATKKKRSCLTPQLLGQNYTPPDLVAR